MSSAGSLGALRARFDRHLDEDSPPQSESAAATGWNQPRATDVVGPIRVVPTRPSGAPSTSSVTPRDGLHSARGALFGVLIGAGCWGVVGGVLYLILR
jgi:hypothetical protein